MGLTAFSAVRQGLDHRCLQLRARDCHRAASRAVSCDYMEKVAMSKEPEKSVVAKARLTMGAPSSTPRSYRVSKAQSAMMRAHDARVEAAEAKKLKAAEKKQAKADKKV